MIFKFFSFVSYIGKPSGKKVKVNFKFCKVAN